MQKKETKKKEKKKGRIRVCEVWLDICFDRDWVSSKLVEKEKMFLDDQDPSKALNYLHSLDFQ